MNNDEPKGSGTTEVQDIAWQAEVELAMLQVIEQALRVALQWMVRGRGNTHKLSTLRFHTWSFERHLTRVQVLADHGGYLRLITEASPHLASDVETLGDERAELHERLESIILRLEHVSHDDAGEFSQICTDLESFLDDLRTHGQKESALLQHSFAQENGGSG